MSKKIFEAEEFFEGDDIETDPAIVWECVAVAVIVIGFVFYEIWEHYPGG